MAHIRPGDLRISQQERHDGMYWHTYGYAGGEARVQILTEYWTMLTQLSSHQDGLGRVLLTKVTRWLDDEGRACWIRFDDDSPRMRWVDSRWRVPVKGKSQPVAMIAVIEWFARWGWEPTPQGMVRYPGAPWTPEPNDIVELMRKKQSEAITWQPSPNNPSVWTPNRSGPRSDPAN